MKIRDWGLLLTLLLCPVMQLNAQFWTENFENGCSSGCAATAYTGANGAWSVVNTGTNGPDANIWYVSCAENGQATGICGAGCGSDESLHMGSSIYGDLGAAYLAGGMGTTPETNKRANSPIINCTGRSNITLSFVYIENGENTIDNASLYISYNGGGAWSLLTDMAKTPLCVGGQGRWQTISQMLPAAANNNANVRLGFLWTNNNNTGTDPSFAVDDITLTVPLPVEMIAFNGYYDEDRDEYNLSWQTASESNSSHFVVEQSPDGIYWDTAGVVAAAGNSNGLIDYNLKVDDLFDGGGYFRILQYDLNGAYEMYGPLYISPPDKNPRIMAVNWIDGEAEIIVSSPFDLIGRINSTDMAGYQISSEERAIPKGTSVFKLSGSSMTPGMYMFEIESPPGSGTPYGFKSAPYKAVCL